MAWSEFRRRWKVTRGSRGSFRYVRFFADRENFSDGLAPFHEVEHKWHAVKRNTGTCSGSRRPIGTRDVRVRAASSIRRERHGKEGGDEQKRSCDTVTAVKVDAGTSDGTGNWTQGKRRVQTTHRTCGRCGKAACRTCTARRGAGCDRRRARQGNEKAQEKEAKGSIREGSTLRHARRIVQYQAKGAESTADPPTTHRQPEGPTRGGSTCHGEAMKRREDPWQKRTCPYV